MSAMSAVMEINKITSCFDQSPNIGLPLGLMKPNPSRSIHMTTCFGIGIHVDVRKVMTRSSGCHSKVKAAQNG